MCWSDANFKTGLFHLYSGVKKDPRKLVPWVSKEIKSWAHGKLPASCKCCTAWCFADRTHAWRVHFPLPASLVNACSLFPSQKAGFWLWPSQKPLDKWVCSKAGLVTATLNGAKKEGLGGRTWITPFSGADGTVSHTLIKTSVSLGIAI